MNTSFVDVVLPLPLHSLTYQVPSIYQDKLSIGSGVLVALRNKPLLAIVVRIHTQPPPYATKPLLGILYETPILDLQQLKFLQWIAHYYLSSFGETLAVALPKALGLSYNMLFKPSSQTPKEENRPLATLAYEQLLLQTLQVKPLTYSAIKRLLGKKETNKVLVRLLEQNAIEAYAATTTWAPYATNPWMPPPPLPLTEIQQKVLEELQQLFAVKEVVLLHGAVGSGKTILYMHCIQEVWLQQKQVLLLLPEIGLTTHIMERIYPFFGEYIVVYHSKQSHKERLKAWLRVAEAQPVIVIGTRSALFLPFKQLKLIIIDEEHDPSYKHSDNHPTYHAREASIILAKQHNAKVLLGSATPAIETYYNAQEGKYGWVTLTDRFGKAQAPTLSFIDLTIDQQRNTLRENFSFTLLDAIKNTVNLGKQVIIFQNRRGYAQYFLCASCGWIPYCMNCSVGLTYHQSSNHLLCHYCGYTATTFLHCSCCGSSGLHNVGFGTEKLEETLQLTFPNQTVGRMDLDSTKSKHSYKTLLKQLSAGSIDILVGTQIIAKGLDLSNIHLVGVLDIDRLLHFPDFRSNEKCFQLMAQLAGRAGRRDEQGKVLIQTRQPNHPIFQYLSNHDYPAMYKAELQERKKFLYPPYVRMIHLRLSCPTEAIVQSGALKLKEALEKKFQDKTQGRVLGPQQPLVGKIRNLFLLNVLVKIPLKKMHELALAKAAIQKIAQKVLQEKPYQTIKVLFDVDPI